MDLIALLFLVTFADPTTATTAPRPRRETGIASVFYTGKDGRFAGGGLACLWGHPRGQHVDRELRFVAHRRLPCGTVVRVTSVRTGQTTLALTLDKGPFGAMHEGRWRMKIKASDPGRWRGIVDLSPGTAKAIDHNGWERVMLEVVELPATEVPKN